MDEPIEVSGQVEIPPKQTQQPSKAAVDFLMQEYQILNQYHNMHKELGDTRLATFITMTGAVFTTLIAAQSFIRTELGPLLLAGGSLFLLLLGVITYRKMLVRRAALVISRRKMARIRIWFLCYYPELASGMAYSDNDHVKIDWGKYKIGTTARYIVLVNCALIILPFTWWIAQSYSVRALAWVIPLDVLIASGVWFIHIIWKQYFFIESDKNSQHELESLEALKGKYGPVK